MAIENIFDKEFWSNWFIMLGLVGIAVSAVGKMISDLRNGDDSK